MHKPELVIVIINFNGAPFLPECLDSLQSQTYKKSEIVVIDNGSTDASIEIIKKYKNIELIVNKENNGYSGAADQSCHLAKSRGAKYVMLLNPDIVFSDDYIEKIIEVSENDPQIGSAQGKLVQYDFKAKKPTGCIDSTGLAITKTRRVVDRGQGEKDEGQYEESTEVFGTTGACPIYKMSVLDQIKVGDEYFDRSFFMYKEDIDISWRILLCGFTNFYRHDAIAYHGRGTGAVRRSSLKEIRKHRSKISDLAKYHSYKNHRLMQVKNESIGHLIKDFPWIIAREIGFFGYILVKEQRLIKSFFQMLAELPAAIKKRRVIQKKRKATNAEIAKWFV